MEIHAHHLDIMLEHVHGPQVLAVRDSARRNSVAALIRGRFLMTTPYLSKFPTHTILTENGRHFVAKRLAAMAEVLVRTGCLEYGVPVAEAEIYRRISARRDRQEGTRFEKQPPVPLP